MDRVELAHRFKHHAPVHQGQTIAFTLSRNCATDLAIIFDGIAPDCREKSTAMTKLEEAMFHINAAIARNADYYSDASTAQES